MYVLTAYNRVMHSIKLNRALRAFLLSSFVIFAFGFSHLTFGQPSTMGMEGMSEHSSSSVQCQIVCTAAIKTDAQGVLTNLENDAKDPLSTATLLGEITLSLLAITFVVKRLHLLSSWRPPDRIILCGHYADGL